MNIIIGISSAIMMFLGCFLIWWYIGEHIPSDTMHNQGGSNE